jgi:hypothetical protein
MRSPRRALMPDTVGCILRRRCTVVRSAVLDIGMGCCHNRSVPEDQVRVDARACVRKCDRANTQQLRASFAIVSLDCSDLELALSSRISIVLALLLSLYWGVEVIRNVTRTATSGAVASW